MPKSLMGVFNDMMLKETGNFMSDSTFDQELHLPIKKTVPFGNYTLEVDEVYLIEGILYCLDENDEYGSLKPTQYINRRDPNLSPDDIKDTYQIFPIGEPLEKNFSAVSGDIIAVKGNGDVNWRYRDFSHINEIGYAVCLPESPTDPTSWKYYSTLSNI